MSVNFQNRKELEEQANRCYLCKKPRCKEHCPIATPIPEIIQLYKEGKYEEAAEILFRNNPLSVVCGIVCPHERQCYGNCIRTIKDEGVKFFEIETFLSYEYLKNLKVKKIQKKQEKIAIVGSGPAGIALAVLMAMDGYDITMFEKKDEIGGILRYGIPKFRLPREILDFYERLLTELGVKIRVNTLVGPIITLDRLLEDYNAVFLGTGVWNPKALNIKGETLGHVHYAINYLMNPEHVPLGDKVLVIGAGNVAMDAARSAKYYGAKEVTVVYRKGLKEMPATKIEIDDAMKDDVQFEFYKSPVEITEDGMIFVETEQKVDENGAVTFHVKKGSETLIKADSIIIAVSQGPKANIVNYTSHLEVDRHGLLVTNEYGQTTRKRVFASGDVVTGARTVVEAVANAKLVAKKMLAE